MALWWLSYADEVYGNFNGALVVEAPDFLAACAKSKLLGIDPGGEVLGFEIDTDLESKVAPEDRNRLLSLEEIQKHPEWDATKFDSIDLSNVRMEFHDAEDN